MRRLIAAAVASGVLLVAGCSSDKAATPAPAAAPDPATSSNAGPGSSAGTGKASGAAGDAALSANTSAICDQAAKTGGNAASNFAQDVKLLIDAESAKNKAAVAAAKEKTTRDVENYSFALQDMSKLVADPAVKKALAEMSESVAALKGDVRKIDAAELGKLQGSLDKACGKG